VPPFQTGSLSTAFVRSRRAFISESLPPAEIKQKNIIHYIFDDCKSMALFFSLFSVYFFRFYAKTVFTAPVRPPAPHRGTAGTNTGFACSLIKKII
jgi:hypothetical protein